MLFCKQELLTGVAIECPDKEECFRIVLQDGKPFVRDKLGLVPTSRPKDHYIWFLASQTSLGALYSSALHNAPCGDGIDRFKS